MNLLTDRKKQERYKGIPSKRFVDEMGSSKRSKTVFLKPNPPKERRFFGVDILKFFRSLILLRRARSKVAPRRGIDGVLISVQSSEETLLQKIHSVRRMLLRRPWRPLSVTGAFLFGVFSTGAVYHSLQASFAAESSPVAQVAGVSDDASDAALTTGENAAAISEERVLTDEDITTLADLIADSQENQVFEERLRTMVAGYPIEAMIPDILKQDRMVAAFMVSIAKKESNWGKRVPVLDGQDCFNYWGYRGIRDRMGTGGHTCFESRQDAVNTVAKRISTLIQKNHLDTPQKMIIWKCGSSCSGHSHESVVKWITDVEMYFSQLNQDEDE